MVHANSWISPVWQSAFSQRRVSSLVRPAISQELASARLHDPRCVKRLVKITQALEANPSFSIPQACGGNEADITATYRFLNNPAIHPEEILFPHFQASSRRIASHRRVLIAHDTTDFTFKHKGEHPTHIQLEHTSQHTEAFYAHASLATTADGQRIPLGLIAWQTWSRHEAAPKKFGENKESIRWFQQMKAAQSFVPEGTLAIHLADRDADDYTCLAQAQAEGMHFIVRSSSHRRLAHVEGSKNKTPKPPSSNPKPPPLQPSV